MVYYRWLWFRSSSDSGVSAEGDDRRWSGRGAGQRHHAVPAGQSHQTASRVSHPRPVSSCGTYTVMGVGNQGNKNFKFLYFADSVWKCKLFLLMLSAKAELSKVSAQRRKLHRCLSQAGRPRGNDHTRRFTYCPISVPEVLHTPDWAT